MDSMRLSVATLRRLVDGGRLALAEGSPLQAALQRPAEAESEPPEELPSSLPEAVEILAQPDALVRLRVAAPGRPESVFQIGVRAGRSAMFALEKDGFALQPPSDLPDLARSLAAEGTHQGPLTGNQTLLWSSELWLATVMWGEGRDPDVALPRAEAEARLVGAGFSAPQANAAIGDKIMTGSLERSGTTVLVPSHLRPWLALFWSGHGFRVEFRPASGNGDVAKLLFIGPSGSRVLAEQLSGEALQARFKDRKAREAAALWLIAPTPERVLSLTRALLGLPAEAAGS